MAIEASSPSLPRPIKLSCPNCPRRDRDAGELRFEASPTAMFIWVCERGHAWAMRALTRAERRAYRNSHHHAPPTVVATPWELDE